jgi:hypothetical protein
LSPFAAFGVIVTLAEVIRLIIRKEQFGGSPVVAGRFSIKLPPVELIVIT